MDESIELVILDVMMPLMNGYTACSGIRQRYTVPILFLTARSQESMLIESENSSIIGFSI